MERVLELLFRIALLGHPAHVRREYGEEAAVVFRDALRDRARRGLGIGVWGWRAVVDAAASGLRERVRSGRARVERTEEDGMGARLAEFWREVRLAVRTLRRSPGFALAAVVILALGIGANTAVFSAVRTVVLAPPPFPDAHELVLVDLADSSTVRPMQPRAIGWSFPKFRMLQEQGIGTVHLAGFAQRSLSLTGAGDPVLLTLEVVTPEYFRVLGITPRVGRDFLAEDDTPEADLGVLLSHQVWEERFGADPGIAGQKVTLAGRAVTVVGVAPAGFRGLTGSAQAWIPVHTAGELITPIMTGGAQAHWLRAVARLPREGSLARLQEELRGAGRALDEAFPRTDPETVSVGNAVTLAEASVSDEARRALVVLLLASGLLLLTACANLAGLLTARGASRATETAVRRALGASRGRVARTFLMESLILSLAGGVAALLVARLGVEALSRAWPSRFVQASWNVGFVRPEAMTVDLPVLGYALALAVVCGMVFGVFPALSQWDRAPSGGLGAGGGVGRRGAGAVRRGLVMVEVALALVLVVGAGLLLRSFTELQEVDRGFRSGNLMTFGVVVPRSSPRMEDLGTFNEELAERFAAIPGVESAAVTCAVPLAGHCWFGAVRQAGSQSWEEGSRPTVGINPVNSTFLPTLGIEVLRGRGIQGGDRADAPPVAVISRSAAELLFPDEDALGQTIRISASVTPEGGPGATVVGIVGEVLYDRPEQGTTPEVYISHLQEGGSGTFVLRTRGEPLAMLPAVRAALAEVAPDFPLYAVRTLEDLEEGITGDTRVLGALISLFAGLALLLAATGIWAVVAFGVTRRTRELGVRMALGARRDEVVRLVVRDDLRVVLIGLGLGAGIAWMASRVLESQLFGVSARDPLAFGAAVAVLLVAGLAAAWIPARRASKLEPVEALRSE